MIILIAVGGIAYLRYFVNNKLSPLVAKELSQLVNRPVEIGAVKSFSLTGLRIGASALPASPEDPDFATVPEVSVAYNPLLLLSTRTLNLNITLINPQLYVEQDEAGNWLQLKLKTKQEPSGPIKIQLDNIRIRNASLVLAPNPQKRAKLMAVGNSATKTPPPAPFAIRKLNGKAEFSNQQKQVNYEVTGTPDSGGQINIQGESLLPSPLRTKIVIRGTDLAAKPIMPLIPNVPIEAYRGQIDCNIGIELEETEVLSWWGTAGFKNITGQLAGLQKGIAGASGLLKFRELAVDLDNTVAIYGQLPLRLSGSIDTESEYNLSIEIPPANQDQFIKTLDLEIPVPVTAEAAGDLRVTGALNNPILSGVVATTKTSRIDLVDFSKIRAEFKIENQILTLKDLQATPVVGGRISGQGTMLLGEVSKISIDVRADDLPGDKLGGIYSGAPVGVKIGAIGADVAVTGSATAPLTTIQWQAPNALYPSSGQLQITKETTTFNNTIIQIGGGSLRAEGQLIKNNWQAILRGEQIQLSPLIDPKLTADNPQLATFLDTNPAIISTSATLSGNLSSFAPADIIAAGEMRLAVNNSIISAKGNSRGGKWQATANFNDGKTLNLNQFAADIPVPVGLSGGSVTVVGNTDLFTAQNNTSPPDPLKQIAASGTLQLDVKGIATGVKFGLQQGQWQAEASLNPKTPLNLQTLVGARHQQYPGVTQNVNDAVPLLTYAVLKAAGNTDAFLNPEPTAILEAISLSGAAKLNIAGGETAINGSLSGGFWQAEANITPGTSLALNPIAPQLPVSIALTEGNIKGSGNTDAFLNLQPLRARHQQHPGVTTNVNDAVPLLLQTISLSAEAKLNIAGGAAAVSGTLVQGKWEAEAKITPGTPLALNPLAPQLPIPVTLTDAAFKGAGTTAAILNNTDPMALLETLNVSGEAKVKIGGGDATLGGSLRGGNWQAAGSGTEIALNGLAPQLPVPVILRQGSFTSSGSLDKITSLDDIIASGAAQLNLAGGDAAVKASAGNGRWQAAVTGKTINLTDVLCPSSFVLCPVTNDQGQGTSYQVQLAQGDVKLSGSMAALTIADTMAYGAIKLVSPSPSLPGSPAALLPLESAFRWDGEKLQVLQAKAPGFQANGVAFVDAKAQPVPVLKSFDFNVNAQQFDLANLPLPVDLVRQYLPGDDIVLAGLADFQGQIKGSARKEQSGGLPLPFDVQVDGNLHLQNLVALGRNFAPEMAGMVRVDTREEISFWLSGGEDKIELALKTAGWNFGAEGNLYPPSMFAAVKQGDISLETRLERERLLVSVANFPLEFLQLAPAPEFGFDAVTGSLSGEGDFDLRRLVGKGEIVVAQPRLGYLQAVELKTQAMYDGESLTLGDGLLRLTNSSYSFNARIKGGDNPAVEGKIGVTDGDLGDIMAAMRWFTLEDLQRGLMPPEYAKKEALNSVPVGMSDASLLMQLRRLSEITALLQKTAAVRQTPGTPEMLDLRGKFSGEIGFAGTLAEGISADFNLEGQSLQWLPNLPYHEVIGLEVVKNEGRVIDVDRAVARGSFKDGVVTFNPLRLEAKRDKNTVVSFVGSLAPENQLGQVRVENLAIADLRNFIDTQGYEVDGWVNLKATIAGTILNPQALGEVSFSEVRLNGEPLENLRGSFNYAQSRLNFSTIAPSNLQVTASLPVPPTPDNNAISFSGNISDDGLKLINILSGQQVEWVTGSGRVEIEARARWDTEKGRITELVATGDASFEDATINSLALPEPLTGVRGKARFERDRVFVETAKGNFSKGLVEATGVLPLYQPLSPTDTDAGNPLTVVLEGIKINLKGLYSGGVEGRVSVEGTFLSPRIGGNVSLFDGVVLLPDPSQQVAAPPPPETEEIVAPRYDDLRLRLRSNVRVASPPLLEFVAQGNLRVNGFIDDVPNLDIKGVIRLLRGRVNLWTTQFRLERGYEHFARFVGDSDPVLQVRLIAAVPEVTRRETVASGSAAEIAENINTTIGAVRTVRVQAAVNGRSSQLLDLLELKSSPPRDEGEIVALIGGGFITTLGRADSPLAIANLAGSALLNNVQDTIGNTLNLSEFRLGPSLVKSGRSTQLALEAEAGIDVTDNLSVSVFRILLENQNTRYNVRYRFNDKILGRGSTDFQGDTQAGVEFEFRF
ncbi:translocation/assembly module TamB domain-containing protein [[Phormidium] sp. ETS-05]|uniref:translocation/assembly module TamB domain-containing protein n=1 Tax=[Phormidium] sp. ETS-05 TaxID=222819 RepID=UPI0018EF2289|nr:translocation/assembly module TamB domain-containing protein [[Phormidium] sp. ETS-05]